MSDDSNLASAGNGGTATASANGGAVSIGDVNSGGNSGNAIGVGDTNSGEVKVDFHALGIKTDNLNLGDDHSGALQPSAEGGTGVADASGGDVNTGHHSDSGVGEVHSVDHHHHSDSGVGNAHSVDHHHPGSGVGDGGNPLAPGSLIGQPRSRFLRR